MNTNDNSYLPWLAGFFDGEGCVIIGKYFSRKDQRSQYDLRVSLSQKYRPTLLNEINKRFGGNVYHNSKTDVDTLVMTSTIAAKFLEAILPYTKVKSEQIELALIFQNNRGWKASKQNEQIYGVMKQLKKMAV